MPARLIDGEAVAAKMNQETAATVAELPEPDKKGGGHSGGGMGEDMY